MRTVIKCHWQTFSFTLIAALGFLTETSQAELSLASPFTDNAVLQQAMPVPVWGTTTPKADVTVEFADQKKSAKADAQGRWKIVLEPMKATKDPRQMVVRSSSGDDATLKNIVVGEVWICSGQSNMQWGHQNIPEIKALIPTVKNLRQFTVKQTVAFAKQDRCEGQWIVKHPNSAVAFAFAYHLEQAADVPVGIVQTCWGSSSIEGWMPLDMTEKLPHFKKLMSEFDADVAKRTRIESILNGPKPWGRKNDIFLRRQPNIIYNAMMHPLAPMACRGIVWYQGEANAKPGEPARQYGRTLPAWIKKYRELWGRDLHFIVVMLPGYAKGLKNREDRPDTQSWARMRESQMKALGLTNTSIANTIDLGHPTNIHPPDKLPVGQRLALLAAQDTLGIEVAAHGPKMKKVEAKDGKLIVRFDHADGLKTHDGEAPCGFWLADGNHKWVKAKAELVGETVVLRHPKLKQPRYVRYAFAGKPKVNLVNEAGLPAFPFRTDEFDH